MPVDGEMTSELHRFAFAGSSTVVVGNGFEIGIMGEAENAAVDFDAGKAQHLVINLIEHDVQRLFSAERVAAVFE